MINHFPFTSRERPRALLWKRFSKRFAIALPLGAHRARLQNCSRTWPMAKQMLSHWLQGRGWRWGEPSFGVAGLWARRLVAADCRHPDLRARRPATPKRRAPAPGSPPLARHWLSAHAPGSPPLACHWLRLWRVREQFCRRAPCAPQVKANASHKVKRFQKRCRGRSRGSESLVRITPLSPPPRGPSRQGASLGRTPTVHAYS